MNKIVTTYTKYDQNLHKDILGRQFDKEGNEFYYQPERLNEKTCSEGFFPPPWNINDHPEKTEDG